MGYTIDLSEKSINSETIKGKPIVINFWFTTCLPCIVEMPELNRLKKKYKNSDIVFLAMTFETKNEVLRFLEKRKFDFTIIPNVKEYIEQCTESYPLNIFVDREGIIRHIQDGMPIVYDAKAKKISDKGKVDPTKFEKALISIK